MHSMLQNILDTVAQNPTMAILVAFLIAAGEALIVVGLFVPSTPVLIGIGSLIGLGKLPFWPVFFAVTLGAVVGDALSYWLGHHYRERLYNVWPFSRYQGLLQRGQQYFANHGGKSVVIGRFVPGVKSVIPGIAGMMGMSPVRFSVLNVLSSLAWAATHLLPGMSAGLLLVGVSVISKRLAMMLGVLLVASILLFWLGKWLITLGVQYAPRIRAAVTTWGRNYEGRGSATVQRLLSTEQAGFRLLLLLNLLLVVGIAGIVLLLDNISEHGAMFQFDHAFSQSIQALRTHWTDPVMLAVTLLGDAGVVAAVMLVILVIIAWQRRWHLLLGVATGFVSATLFVNVLKWLVQRPRPVEGLYTGVSAYSFPSGHATINFVLLGLLGWFVWRGCRPVLRNILLAFLLLFATLIAFSRIYLGAHWPSDVLAGWLFGIGLIAVFAQFFRHETIRLRLIRQLVAGALLTYVMVGGWHIHQQWQHAEVKYAVRATPPVSMVQPWRAGGWSALPAYRQDISGEREEPFVLQWQGSPQQLQQALAVTDWQPAVDWSVSTLNRFAAPNTAAVELPVLPKLNKGRANQYVWVKAATLDGQSGRYVLRLYQQTVQATGQSQPTDLWLGTVEFEGLHHPLGQLSLTWPADVSDCQATPLLTGLPQAQTAGVVKVTEEEQYACGGQRVLAEGE